MLFLQFVRKKIVFLHKKILMQTICVYCGSSSQVNPAFFEQARKFGKILAENHIALVYGAGNMGLMGEIAKSALENGGKVIGVIPQFMYDENWYLSELTELIITETMHERKQKMIEISDALVALPGGCGTFEELFEAITWKQLGLITQPIVIANFENYYQPILSMFDRAVEENFIREKHTQMWQIVNSPDEILPAIQNSATWCKTYRKFVAI